jgi:L-histidine Nalpha-methyltransferase
MESGPATPFTTAPDAGAALNQFAADVQYYLTQSPRQLPSRYLYDELGSALFEAICSLPWYPITRAESRLLDAHADEIFQLTPFSTVVELGPGSGEKLRLLIDAGDATRSALNVHLVDVSRSALQRSAGALAAVDRVRLFPHQAEYEAGLAEATAGDDASGPSLVLFLGSNIGNFDRPGADAFLRTLRGHMADGDALLLGADLVKPVRDLTLAYDDPLGVTAAFNRNLLVRINRELGGNFDLAQFAHRAVWNAAESRVEMHLVARSSQHIEVTAAGLTFGMSRGEPIWTESSYKYRPQDVIDLVERAGFRLASQWIDRDAGFALTLAQAR